MLIKSGDIVIIRPLNETINYSKGVIIAEQDHAFIDTDGTTIRKGDTGKVLKKFKEKDTKVKAKKELDRLHRENKPAARNKGAAAKSRHKKRSKKKK